MSFIKIPGPQDLSTYGVAHCDCTYDEACTTGCATYSSRETEWRQTTISNVSHNDVFQRNN